MLLISKLRRRLAGEDGFTMAIVMGVLIFSSILGIAAWSAAQGGTSQSGESRDRKQAYAAAEAGLNWYQARLAADNDYWTKCTSVPAVATGVPAPVNAAWDGTPVASAVTPTNPSGDPRIWRTLSGSTAQYTIELLPAPGKTTCSQSNMVDNTGGFRIRATGRYNGVKRSIIGRFTRQRFLNFLYFTDFETTDPLAYPTSQVTNANAYCAGKYRTARGYNTATPPQYVFGCSEIQFAPGDKVKGPLHSNDSLLICGPATFGRAPVNGVPFNDSVESWSNPGYYKLGDYGASGCSGNPVFQGTTFKAGVDRMEVPDTNDALKANAGLTLYGSQRITLKTGGQMQITNLQTNATQTRAVPANGVLYVDTDPGTGCARTVQPRYQEYSGTNAEPMGCANVYLDGTYDASLTIASAKDIVVVGSVQRATGSDALLGLIPNNFVRVYHPVTSHSTSGSCPGDNITTVPDARAPYGPALSSVRIDAAILSLQHSFTVDSFDCGDQLGNLTVNGAIAQLYRGAVGTSGSGGTGYIKDYNYDDRLRYRNPPQFLDPVNAAWRISRINEQLPAR